MGSESLLGKILESCLRVKAFVWGERQGNCVFLPEEVAIPGICLYGFLYALQKAVHGFGISLVIHDEVHGSGRVK